MDEEKDFIDFIEEMPGLRRYAIAIYERLDNMAVKAGLQIQTRDVAELRAKAINLALSPSLRAHNQQLADALERDPTGRLASVPALRAWSMGRDSSIGTHWVNWYTALLNAWIDAQKASAAKLVPMMATGAALEEPVS